MIIPTSALRAFLQASSRLKPNTLLPVLGFVKFENGKIIKHTLKEFVQYTAEFQGVFMVEERILSTFVSGSKDDEINFAWTDKRVTISDSKGKITSPNEPIDNFPAVELPTESSELSEAVCQSIGIAAQMLSDSETAHPNVKHVFTGETWVFGTDAWIGYMAQATGLPRIILAKGPSQVVSRLKGCQYSSTTSYDLFESGALLYGSVKPECKWFDMSVFTRKDQPGFDLDTSELLAFCDMAVASSGLTDNVATIENGHELRMSFVEPKYEVDLHRTIQVAGPEMAEFRFQPRLMQRLLKAMPTDKLICSREERRICFIGDGFTGMIQEIVKPQNS